MSEKPTYELKGTLREDCMRDIAMLEDFRALESDWQELFRWLMSVSEDLPFRDADGNGHDSLSCLWKDHVLVVLVEILRKDLDGYVTSFVDGQGTLAQKRYTEKLTDRYTDWTSRLDRFIRMAHGYNPDRPALPHEVAEAVEIPCLLYNVPGRTGCAIPEEAVKELSAHPNVAGIKEASGDLSYASPIARYQGEDFALYAGSDDTALPMLALGARGIISVAANLIPGEIHAMAERFLAGDTAGAREIQLRYLPLIRCLFLEVNPIPVKEALDLLGWEVGGCRLPLAPMEPGHRRALRAAMEEVGLL